MGIKERCGEGFQEPDNTRYAGGKVGLTLASLVISFPLSSCPGGVHEPRRTLKPIVRREQTRPPRRSQRHAGPSFNGPAGADGWAGVALVWAETDPYFY